MMIWEIEEAKELAESMRSKDYWDDTECRKLCDLAGMTAEWDAVEDGAFESLIFAAAEKLGVEIL